MPNRMIIYSAVLALVGFTLYLAFFYGPHKRSFIPKAQVNQITSATELGAVWEASGAKGRVAVLFTRHLNSENSLQDTEGVKYAELAMRHGIVRTIYHIVPDSAWPVVSANLAPSKSARTAPEGYVLIFPEGRVHVLPLSKYKALKEPALVVVEPGVWSKAEMDAVTNLIRSGALKTDLLGVIRGTKDDVDRFGAAVPK